MFQAHGGAADGPEVFWRKLSRAQSGWFQGNSSNSVFMRYIAEAILVGEEGLEPPTKAL